MGVAGYSEMARMLGLNDVAEKYAVIAKKMAVKWEEMANEGRPLSAWLSTVRIPGARSIIWFGTNCGT